jgi:hypothetical protein
MSGFRHVLAGSVVLAIAAACASASQTERAPGDGGTAPGMDAADPTSEAGADTGMSEPCDPALTACASGCADTRVDPKNCGGCGKACDVACAAGACVSTCPAPTTNCAGACVDLTTSSASCGACGTKCVNGKVCVASTCSCGAAVSFASQVQVILTAECASAGCHSGTVPKGGLALTTGKSFAALVGVAASGCGGKVRVTPGAVDQSYLINKLTGVGICSGTLMPKAGGALPPAQIDLFRAWICNGAPNN